MKKIKSAILILVISVCGSSIAQTKVFIPDINFRNFLTTQYPTFMDITGDSLIADSAAILTGVLNCKNQNIVDLTGIEYFINIEILSCEENQLTSLPDLSSNTALEQLYCFSNQLTSLPDLSSNTALEELWCYDNQLAVLPDLSSNTALWLLDCKFNQLSSLPDLSANTALQVLGCMYNQLTSLPNLSANTALKSLSCSDNQLTSLPDLSANLELEYLNCSNNQLDSLDLSGNTGLTKLYLADMPTLSMVCIWEIPFPPVGLKIDTTNSPNVYFTIDCIASSLNSNELNSKTDIYPNPNNGLFSVNIEYTQQEKIELRIFNSLGLQLLDEELKQENGTFTGQFDISTYPAGIYYLLIEGINVIINKQIIIE